MKHKSPANVKAQEELEIYKSHKAPSQDYLSNNN